MQKELWLCNCPRLGNPCATPDLTLAHSSIVCSRGNIVDLFGGGGRGLGRRGDDQWLNAWPAPN